MIGANKTTVSSVVNVINRVFYRRIEHMRITKYTTHLDNDRKPILIKENSSNYPTVRRLDSPQK